MTATSATNRRYMESLSPNGLQSTYTLRQQPVNSQRTMSLSNRSFRQSDVPRTMSMTMRSGFNQPGSRSMSMTSNSLRPNKANSINSRTNSLTVNSRSYQNNRNSQRLGSMTNGSRMGSRTGSRAGSRANSLTTNSNPNSNTKIIEKTLEKDSSGRTKSITTKTIEKRGNVKIIRTTVVHPTTQPIEEEDDENLIDDDNDDYDDNENDNELAQLKHFDSHHGKNYNDTIDNDDVYDDDDDDYNNNDDEIDLNNENYYEDDEYYNDSNRNGAATAAAAALAGHSIEPKLNTTQKRQRQLNQQRQRQREQYEHEQYEREQYELEQREQRELELELEHERQRKHQLERQRQLKRQQQQQQKQQQQQRQQQLRAKRAAANKQHSVGQNTRNNQLNSQYRESKQEVRFKESHDNENINNDYINDDYESYNDFYENEIPENRNKNRISHSQNYDDYEQEGYDDQTDNDLNNGYYEPEPEPEQIKPKPRPKSKTQVRQINKQQNPKQRLSHQPPPKVQTQNIKQRPLSQPPLPITPQHQARVVTKKNDQTSQPQQQQNTVSRSTSIKNVQRKKAVASANSASLTQNTQSARTRKLNPPESNNIISKSQNNIKSGNKISNDAPYEQETTKPIHTHFHNEIDDMENDEIDEIDDYANQNNELDDDNEDVEEIMVISPEPSISDSFNTRAQKRLSEIQEVTETYDDEDIDEGGIGDGEDFMEEPILNPLGINNVIPVENDYKKKKFKGRAVSTDYSYSKPVFADNVTTTSSITSDDNFVEAQEEFVDDSPSYTHDDNVNIPKSRSHQFSNDRPVQQVSQSQNGGAHTYRNLLFNDKSRNSTQFDNSYNVNQNFNNPTQKNTSSRAQKSKSPVNYPNNTFNNFDQLEDDVYASNSNVASIPNTEFSNPAPNQQQRKLKLKSALKNSSSSLSSPVSESNPQFARHVNNNIQRNRSQIRKSVSTPISPPKQELSTEEMYALALKAAEKKVYGDRLNDVYPDNDIDDDTKLNTMANIHANPTATTPVPIVTSMNQIEDNQQLNSAGQSHPGVPYQSNAAGLGFRVHSLRDSGSSSRNSKNVDAQETNRLKKFFKYEQKAKAKQWEAERKAATESDLIKKAREKVEKEVNGMPISPEVELQRMQQQHEESKLANSTPIQDSNVAKNATENNLNNVVEPISQINESSLNNGLQSQTQNIIPSEGQHLEKQITGTESQGVNNATSVTSPNKIKLKMFRLSKKKNDSPEHKKRESLFSQDSTQSTSNRRGSVEGKRGKLFSFGFGNHNHHENEGGNNIIQENNLAANTNLDNVQEINNVQEISNPEINVPTNNISLNSNIVDNTNNNVNINNVAESTNIPSTIPSSVPGSETVFTSGQSAGANAGDINTIPEVENNASISKAINDEVQGSNDNAFVQPSIPMFKSHDNFVRGPHGSSSNLLKTGTHNSTVASGSLYSDVDNSANFAAPNINANITEPISNSNMAFTTPNANNVSNNYNNNGNLQKTFSKVPSIVDPELSQPQRITSNVSVSGRKSSKEGGKTSRKFMKFFNL